MYSGDTERIRRIAIDQRRNSSIAEVTKVTTRTDDSVRPVFVSAKFRDGGQELRGVPVNISDHNGHMATPQKGDLVRIAYLTNSRETGVVVNHVPNPDQPPPKTRPGHWRHEFSRDTGDPLYLEAERADGAAGDPDLVRMGVKPDGLASPTTEVAVDDSGATTEVRLASDGDVTIDVDGDVTINANGSITIGADGTAVAPADHTHDYVGGGDNSTTKVSSPPNEPGTSTTIE
jgi:hypothetical protein